MESYMHLTRLFALALLISLVSFLTIATALEATPLNGNYIVGGSGAYFPTLSEALEAANTDGLDGPTSFLLTSGTYAGPFEIDIADNEHTLSIRPLDTAEVWLTNPNSSSTANYVLKITNTSDIYLQGLKFNTSGTYSRAVWIHGNSDDLSIQSCQFHNDISLNTSNREAIYVTADGSSDADNLNISLNAFYNGSAHIYTNAYNSLTTFADWSIYLNYHSGGYYGIYLKQVFNLSINAMITQNINTAVYLDACGGELDIQRNNIAANITGIYMNYCGNISGASPGIVNNIIRISGAGWYNPSYDSDSQGIYLYFSDNIKIYHNSIHNESLTTGSVCLGTFGSGNLIRKNNLASTGLGYTIFVWNLAANTVEYNNLWTSNINLARIQNDYVYDLLTFNDLAGTANIGYYPFFTDDQLRTVAPKLDNYGPSFGIGTDFNNLPRDASSPDIGAHEFTSDPAMLPLSGTVNVGSGQAYGTLQEFFTALSFRGVSGLLTAQLTDTLYVEQVEGFGIPGSNPAYLVQVKGHTTLGSTLRWDDQTAESNFVLRLRRMTHLDFHDIRFRTASTQYSNLVWMPGYNYKTRFLECEFFAPLGAQGNGILSEYQDINLDFSVLSSGFYNNRYGLQHSGDLLTVGSSWFFGQYVGMNISSSNQCEIAGNIFEGHSNSAITCNGGNRWKIYNNKVKAAGAGFLLYNLSSFEDQYNLIYNNAIHVTSGNQYNGMALGGNAIKLLNNSILCQATNAAALYMYQPGSQIEVINNIFQATLGLALEYVYYSPSADRVMDYNSYYSLGNNTVRLGSNYYGTMTALIAGDPANNLHSMFINPHFTADMHTQSPWLREVGMPRTEFDNDMDYQPRGSLWDIGADQQTGPSGFTPLAGTYSVGPGGDYPDIPQFLDDLHLLGSGDDIVANLLPGVYTGYYTLSDYPRLYPDSRLYFNAMPGASFELIPQYSYGYENYIFRLQGIDKLTLSGHSFNVAASTHQSVLILLEGKCDDIVINACSFNMGSQSSVAIQASQSVSDGLSILDCDFLGGSKALELSGLNPSDNLYQNVRLQSCSTQGTYTPFTLNAMNNLKLLHNSFSDFSGSPSLSYAYGNTDIVSNKLRAHNFVGSYSSPVMLSLSNIFGSEDQPIEILSNLVYSSGNQVQSCTGINLYNSSHIRLFHNSLMVENQYIFQYGSALSMSNVSNLRAINNIFSSPHTGYAIYAQACSGLEFYHNAYYSGHPKLGKIGSTECEAADLIYTQLQDLDGIYADPLPDANGYSTCQYLADKGMESYVMLDIDQAIFGSTPSIGANVITPSPAFSGTVTVGPSGDFSSLDTALDALMSRGIAGNTQLFLQSGFYQLNKRLGFVPNTLVHTLTITGSPTAYIYGSASTGAANYALGLKNTRNLILDGLNIAPQQEAFSRAIAIERFGEDISIQNCHLTMASNNLSTDASAGIYSDNAMIRNLVIQDCQIENFSRGVLLSASSSFPNESSLVELLDNSISGSYYGVNLYNLPAPVLNANQISSFRHTGINMSSNRGAAQIKRNSISGTGYYALYFNNHSAGTQRTVVATNYLSCVSTGWGYAMQLSGSPDVDVYFNTIRMQSPSSDAYGFYHSGSSGLNFACNLAQSSSSYAAVFSTPANLQRKDHNLFYSATGNAVQYGGTNINNLSGWTASTSDASCVFADPLLAAGSYSFPMNSPAINAATVIDGHEWDIVANWRDNPDIGCWEYAVLGLEIPANLSIGIDPASNEAVLNWDPVPGATSYKVWYASSPDAESWSYVIVDQNNARLAAGATQRFYKVSAQN
jgi:hypothetical protein